MRSRQPDRSSADSIKFGVVPTHGVGNLSVTLEQIALCRDYGFDSVWIEEHHAEGAYWPTPLLAIAALAQHLDGLTVGTNILVLPLYDPVHVAEQVAILDRLTSGRFVMGVGIGDSPTEFAAFQVPVNRRGARFEDQIEIIRALWRGETVTRRGDFYNLSKVQLATLPEQEGGPPIWIGGWGPKQLERAARLGDAWLPGPVGTKTEIVGRQRSYDEMLHNAGAERLTRSRPITRDVIIAPTQSEAWAIANGSVLKSYRETYLESDHPLVGTDSGSEFKDLRELARDRMMIGDPASIVAEAARYIKALKCNHFIFRPRVVGVEPHQTTRMLHLLGREVVPQLRQAWADQEPAPEAGTNVTRPATPREV